MLKEFNSFIKKSSYYILLAIGILTLAFSNVIQCSTPDEESSDITELGIEELMSVEVITAGKKPQTMSDVPAGVYVITSKDIAQYGYQTLNQALRKIAGFYSEYDHVYNYVGVRGYLPNNDLNRRVLVLIDGHKVNDYLYGQAPVDQDLPLDMRDIDRIEVIKGPGAVLWGSEALLCVINCITKTARQINGVEVRQDVGWYDGPYVSYGRSFRGGLEVSGSISKLTSDGQKRIYFPEMDRPEAFNGVATGLDGEKAYRGHINVSYKDYRFFYTHGARKKNVPTAYWYGVFGYPGNDVTDERMLAELSYENSKPFAHDGKFFSRVYIDDYDAVLFFNYLYPDAFGSITDPESVIAYNFGRDYANSFGTEARYSWNLTPNLSTIVGTEYLRTYRTRRVNYDLPPYYYLYRDRIADYSINSYYIQADWNINKQYKVVAGSRWDDYSIFGTHWTPRIALIHKKSPKTTFKLLYGEAFRAPSISEARSDQNPLKLYPEKIKTNEFIWEQQVKETGRIVTSLYSYKMYDLIMDIYGPTKNSGIVNCDGFETQYDYHLQNGVSGYLGFAYMNAKSGNPGIVLASSPKYVSNAGVSLPLFKRNANLAFDIQYIGKRKTTKNVRIDDAAIANLNLTSDSLVRGAEVSFGITNLFNTKAYAAPRPANDIVTVLDRIPQLERAYQLKVSYHF